MTEKIKARCGRQHDTGAELGGLFSLIVVRTKNVCDSFLRTTQVRSESSWAWLKAALWDASSKKGKGSSTFLGAGAAVSDGHRKRGASAWAQGTVGQGSLAAASSKRKNQPIPETVKPPSRVKMSYRFTSPPSFCKGRRWGVKRVQKWTFRGRWCPPTTSRSLGRGVSSPE